LLPAFTKTFSTRSNIPPERHLASQQYSAHARYAPKDLTTYCVAAYVTASIAEPGLATLKDTITG